jgi:TetR/AcrR family transcriptional regulator, transcriptional repressor for nem operon
MENMKTVRKNKSHEKILESAGTLIKARGISGASVANVMEGAGMTVGGFYAHFPSKQSLISETIKEALESSREHLRNLARGKKGAEWVKTVSGSYLSRSHRDQPETGCPLPATLGEIAMEDIMVREVLAEEVEKTSNELASRLEEAGLNQPGDEAMAVLAIMVGGLSLARALRGTQISDAILKACGGHIERSLY